MVGGPSEVFASSGAAVCGMRPHGHESLTDCKKAIKPNAARPEGAEAPSPGQRPGFVGVILAPCKGKSFKKHLIKNENSLRYVKLLPLQGVLLL